MRTFRLPRWKNMPMVVKLLGIVVLGWGGYRALTTVECHTLATLPPPYPGMRNARCERVEDTLRLVSFTTSDPPSTIMATYYRRLDPHGWGVTTDLRAPLCWESDERHYWKMFLHMAPMGTETTVQITHELHTIQQRSSVYHESIDDGYVCTR